VSPDEFEALTEDEQVASAPESGQPPGGRPNPWDHDDEPAGAHTFPADHHAPPGDDL
jgi:hypothetical protein